VGEVKLSNSSNFKFKNRCRFLKEVRDDDSNDDVVAIDGELDLLVTYYQRFVEEQDSK
jgi:hypothetical protein